jgi:hypothetical protein
VHPTTAWTNESNGTAEEVRFLGQRGRRLFGVTHLPAGEPRGAVVICSPVLLEHMRSYRREVTLARGLAASGIAVQRFHYQGEGHSEGDPRGLTVERMVADARVAAAALLDVVGTMPVSWVGTRLGALPASAAAASWPAEPLVLWDAVLDPRSYLDELLRARVLGTLRRTTEGDPTPPAPQAHGIDDDVEILGFPLHQPLVDSLDTVVLEERIADHPGPVLLVESSPRGAHGRRRGEARARLAARHPHVEVVEVPNDGAGWWFPGVLSEVDAAFDAPVQVTSVWLGKALTSEMVR